MPPTSLAAAAAAAAAASAATTAPAATAAVPAPEVGNSGYGFFQHMSDQPPPPPPPLHQQPELNGYRGLNVADPRYSAKYGNPYLVQYAVSLDPDVAASSSPAALRRAAAGMTSNGRGYATLNTRSSAAFAVPASNSSGGGGGGGGYSKPQKKVNYANDSLARISSKHPKPQYIISPEHRQEAAAAAAASLATHV